MGLAFGVCYAIVGGLLLGGVLLTNSTTKQEWMTFDFVNRKYVETEEKK
jgi:hypothetical protein